jgi:hypothetical protein
MQVKQYFGYLANKNAQNSPSILQLLLNSN